MKTMTCADLSGPCDAKMTAATPDELVKMAMAHVESAHPDLAAKVKAMPKEETEKWMADFTAKWNARPEDAAPAA
jgi:predicted small metal-binding protein